MTRINVISPEELSDQWLIAEYRELPRVIKGEFNLKDAPDIYRLGRGHVKWAKKHAFWVMSRYFKICDEMEYRGFMVNYKPIDLIKVWDKIGFWYDVTLSDMCINVKRLIEKYKSKPNYYKWTKRDKPQWLFERKIK